MKSVLFFAVFCLLTFSINAQNGVYSCKRQEYRSFNLSENKISHEKCKITIQIFGIGGDDFVSAEIISEQPNENITYKWKINSEIQMAPDAKGKRIYNSYSASLIGAEEENNNYQITIVKKNKKDKISVVAIDANGSTYWYYDLEKIK